MHTLIKVNGDISGNEGTISATELDLLKAM